MMRENGLETVKAHKSRQKYLHQDSKKHAHHKNAQVLAALFTTMKTNADCALGRRVIVK